MKTLILKLAAVLSMVSTLAFADPHHAMIVLDDSISNLMVTDSNHAQRVAKDFERDIGEFQMRDRITLTTAGDFHGNRILEFEIDKSLDPDRALRDLVAMIGEFPSAVNTVLDGAASVTHIQGALLLASSRVNCSAYRTTVYLLTDGQETGDTLRAHPGLYDGCDGLVMFGVIGRTPAETAELIAAWKSWCSIAGFRRCVITN